MNCIETLIGSVVTATVALLGVDAVSSIEEHAVTATTIVEAEAVGRAVQHQRLLDDFALPASLTCAADPCTTFLEVPTVTVTGRNHVVYDVTDAAEGTFTVTLTAEDGTAAVYDSSTGTTRTVG